MRGSILDHVAHRSPTSKLDPTIDQMHEGPHSLSVPRGLKNLTACPRGDLRNQTIPHPQEEEYLDQPRYAEELHVWSLWL